ncbi:hypothetical protein DAH39_28575 [Escherichia coli]|nr:hypothetical protein [Escherichia coli]EHW78356.1 putative transposase [Escherichia coli DEC10B]EEQ7394276.1 hypothetical protein [Escherichia coli]EES2721208.1 hypothetical protein [Escherichia coli]EES3152682.1 hypothetical protein [Escherichia coli]
MLPSETMIWQPEFTDKTLSRKTGAVQTGPVNKAIIDTAQFLKEQGKVPAVANDYSQYVTSRFVQ